MPLFPNSQPASLDHTWVVVKEGIEAILELNTNGLTNRKYIEIYTAIYNFCTSNRAPAPTVSSSGATLIGRELYDVYNDYMQNHVNQLCLEADNHKDDDLLRFYNQNWTRFSRGSGYLNHLFRYLNRHWVKREQDEGKNKVYEIHVLNLIIWKAGMYEKIKSLLTDAVLKLAIRDRNGESVDMTMIKGIVETFVVMGIDEEDATRSSLNEYTKNFETPYIESMQEYYRTESDKFLAENPVTEYLKKAQKRLKEEEEKAEMYLHQHTREHLLKTCEDVLIKRHSENLQEGFCVLLENDQYEDGLVPLREQFEKHVRKIGLASIDKLSEMNPDTLEPKTYVDALLEIHQKYLDMVKVSFSSESGFIASMDRACREVVNRNKVCKSSSSKTSELLARYSDSLLKKSANNPEESEMENYLNSILTIFKYVDDKDIFQKFYSRMLAKRLVHQSSASDDAEASMISKLRDVCGFEYTSKLQRMFTDMGLSKDLNDQFRDRMQQSDETEKKMDFYIMVLTQSQWPLAPPSTTFKIPEDLSRIYERIQMFYQNKHSNRRLQWLWQHSKGELRASYFNHTKAGYTFQVSTFQMGILLQYNEMTIYSWEELLTRTGMTKEALVGPLEILVKARVLLLTGGNMGDDGTNYKLNSDFKSKKMRVNLNMPVRTEQKQEAEDTNKTVEEDRKILIQAAIVRVMKTRKLLKHVDLVTEVITQLQGRFRPKVPDIKRCIDMLLEKEYIERVEGQKDMFQYLA